MQKLQEYAGLGEDGRRSKCTVSAGDLHYIPLTGLLMAPITEIGPNWHQPKLDQPKVLLTTTGRPASADWTNLRSGFWIQPVIFASLVQGDIDHRVSDITSLTLTLRRPAQQSGKHLTGLVQMPKKHTKYPKMLILRAQQFSAVDHGMECT